MSINPLDPASDAGRPDRDVTKGHGTRALGPSDSSDSGSDIGGAAAADIGDANLDSDSDRNGTGERAAVGHDDEADASDIDVDRIEEAPEDFGEDEEE